MGEGTDEMRRTTWTSDEPYAAARREEPTVAHRYDRIDRTDYGRDKSSGEIRMDIEHTRAEMDETIRALKTRLSPDLLKERAIDNVITGLRTEARDMAKAARRNPLPAGLIAAGLAWLIYDTLTYSETDEFETAEFGPEQTFGYKAKSTVGSIKDKAKGALMGAARGARNVTSGVAHRARYATGSIAGRVREGTGHMAERARERSSGFASGAKERTGELAHRARERSGEIAHRMGEKTSRQAQRAKAGFDNAVVEHPLAVCLGAFAVGTAIALAFPETRKEDELMGETRDRLKEKAKARGRETMEKAQSVAEETLSSAKETAKQSSKEEFSQGSTERRHEEGLGPIS